MPISERTPAMAPREPDQRHQCNRAITLNGTIYRCLVRVWDRGCVRDHGGAHDAFVVHADGFLVRW